MVNVLERPSPNFDDRPSGAAIDTVIIHYTGMRSWEEALDRMCDPNAKVSAHYMIDETGRLYQLVPEEKRAWHAGVSIWQGREHLNHYSIGIELVNPGDEFGYRPFPEPQIESLLFLLENISKRHTIMSSSYVGHSDIAPDRKTDPGELFPWRRLAGQGFGVWSDKDGSSDKIILEKGQAGSLFDSLNKQLGMIGYNTANSLVYDANIEYALRAFQAHWRPELVSGCYDEGTALIMGDVALKVVRKGRVNEKINS